MVPCGAVPLRQGPWQNHPMQAYLALTADDLGRTAPPARDALLLDPADVPEGGSWDDISEDARAEAGILSLELARQEETIPTRLVASATLAKGKTRVETWAQVDSLYVDDVRGRELCAQICVTEDQDEADALVEELLAESLMWFDSGERGDLGRLLLGTETIDEV